MLDVSKIKIGTLLRHTGNGVTRGSLYKVVGPPKDQCHYQTYNCQAIVLESPLKQNIGIEFSCGFRVEYFEIVSQVIRDVSDIRIDI